MAAVTYHAKVERDGKFWLVHVIEIDKWTQARNLREVEPMARDLISIIEEIASESIELDVSIEIPAEAKSHWERSKELHELADALKAEAAAEAQEAVHSLVDMGLTLREVGASLGLSFQRAGQLANPHADGGLVKRRVETISRARRFFSSHPDAARAFVETISDEQALRSDPASDRRSSRQRSASQQS
ncbi:hypothetical protein ACWEKT_23985 [Nocardia takedensis]